MNPTAVMSDSREKFESFMKGRFPGVELFWDEFVNEYVHANAHVAFVSWQASRTAAMGEAARIVDAMRTRAPEDCDDSERGFNGALRMAAMAIRAAGEGSKG